jgi:hypothetical protein
MIETNGKLNARIVFRARETPRVAETSVGSHRQSTDTATSWSRSWSNAARNARASCSLSGATCTTKERAGVRVGSGEGNSAS